MTYVLVKLYSNFKLINVELISDNQDSVYFLSLFRLLVARETLPPVYTRSFGGLSSNTGIRSTLMDPH